MEKSLLQAEAELSRFDDDGYRLKLERAAYNSDVAAAREMEVVSGRVDAFYDPADPRADWSGMVPNTGTRKAVEGAEGARMHIERTAEGGIVAAEDYHEKQPGGKKHWADDGRFATESQRSFPGHGVGGWGAPTPGQGSFVTSSQLAAKGAATEHEFYGDATKRRGKRQVKPAYENAGAYRRPPPTNPILGGGAAQPPARRAPQPQPAAASQPHRSGSLAGYRSNQFNAGAKSMLATAASGIAQKIDSPVVAYHQDQWHGPSRTKEVFEPCNFRDPSAIVGYTGRRS